jgi:RNA polymerase-binding protein DksA
VAKKKVAKSVKKKRRSAKKQAAGSGSARSPKSKGGARKKKTSKKTASTAKKRKTGAKKSAKKSTKRGASARKTSKAKKTKKRATPKPKAAARRASSRKPKASAKRPRKPVAAVVAAPRKTTVRKLSPKDIEQFRALLLEKRAELAGDVTTLQNEALNKNRRDAAGDLSSMPIHMADLGSDNYEKEFTLGLIEGERELLKQIDAALKRIADGTFGICEATGRPISKARLKVIPWARYCYEYVLAQEDGRYSGG